MTPVVGSDAQDGSAAGVAPRVLIVDDTPGNRYAASHVLRGAGMQITECGTGGEALRLVRTHPDLIVLDVNLPDMSGLDVCRAVKSDRATSRIPVLQVSATFVDPAERAHGLDAGADAYITHPLDPALFLATARALLRVGRAEAALLHTAREWRLTFDAIGDAVLLVGGGGMVRRCNRAASDLVGREPRDVVGRPLVELLATLAPEPADAFAPVLAGESVRGLDVRLARGWFAVSVDCAESGADGESLIVVVLSDVGPRRAAVAERERLLAAAEEARRDAVAANRAKSDFLAVMSHELRTPLNAIGGFVELLELGIRGPITEAQHTDLQKIRRSQVTLMRLINNLLGFAKVESGSLEYSFTDFDVDRLFAVAAELIEPQLRAQRIAFHHQPSLPSLTVRADRDKVEQIVLNLLSNALKFTEPGGTITASSERRGKDVVLRVADTGCGIPAEKLEAIFDPFMQVDQRFVREHAGIGLGLSISRDLARAMGGDLRVESVVGAGSVFSVLLPAA